MADSVRSQGDVDAENEIKTTDSAQKELKTLEKQSLEGESVSKVLSASSNDGQISDVVTKSGNLSAEIENSPESSSEIESKEDNTTIINGEECGNFAKTTGEVGKEVNVEAENAENSFEIANKLELNGTNNGSGKDNNSVKATGVEQKEGISNTGNAESLPPSGENWDEEMKDESQPDFILKSKDAKEDVEGQANDGKDCDSKMKVCGIASESPQAMQDMNQSLYHIKWMRWKNINTPIITQNENGPCPLIALINALLLQRKISIPPMQEIVSANQLMEYLGDCILDQAPERLTEGAQANYEQNMADAIAIMCKLQTGLDVNVKFTGVADFEFTPECVVFDLFNIRLMHGWLVDPQNREAVLAIGNLSYNQIVEKIIASKQEGADPDLVSAGLVAESFLDQSATQLTYHGLYELSAQLGEEELCIFFRNNHFNTLFKHKNELFVLVTDQGFLTEDKVMWETLSNVEGDGYFVDANFRTSPSSQPPVPPPPTPNTAINLQSASGISQEDQDYLVALSLQEEQSKIDQRERDAREREAREREAREREARERETPAGVTVPAHSEPSSGMTSQEWSDLQLALQLQKEEQRQQQQQQQQARPATANVPRGSPSHATSTPPATLPQQRPQTAPPQQSSHPNNNEKCRIL